MRVTSAQGRAYQSTSCRIQVTESTTPHEHAAEFKKRGLPPSLEGRYLLGKGFVTIQMMIGKFTIGGEWFGSIISGALFRGI